MAKPLLIVWQNDFLQDEPIIDEQHRGVLASINSLHYFLQQGQGLEVLMPTIKICMSYMMFHGSTEEGILRAANYSDIDSFVAGYKKDVAKFKEVCKSAMLHHEPEEVLLFLRKWWQQHMELHKEITPLFEECKGQFCRLDLKN